MQIQNSWLNRKNGNLEVRYLSVYKANGNFKVPTIVKRRPVKEISEEMVKRFFIDYDLKGWEIIK